MKIGVYCGTFSPITNGHLSIMATVIDKFNLGLLIIVPTGDTYPKKKIPYCERVKLIRKALKETGLDKKCVIEDYEFLSTFTPTTWETMQYLEEKYPVNELHCILGIDNILEIPEWENGIELIKDYKIICVERQGLHFEQVLSNYDFEPYLQNISFCTLPYKNNISSSLVRELLFRSKPLIGLVPSSITEEITDNIEMFKKCYGRT